MHLSIKMFHKFIVITFVLFHFVTYGISRTKLFRAEAARDFHIDFFDQYCIKTNAKNILFCMKTIVQINSSPGGTIKEDDIIVYSNTLDVTMLTDTILSRFFKDQKENKDILPHIKILCKIPYKQVDLMKTKQFLHAPSYNDTTDKNITPVHSFLKTFEKQILPIKQSLLKCFKNKTIDTNLLGKKIEIFRFMLASSDEKNIIFRNGLFVNGHLLSITKDSHERIIKYYLKEKKEYKEKNGMDLINGLVYFIEGSIN